MLYQSTSFDEEDPHVHMSGSNHPPARVAEHVQCRAKCVKVGGRAAIWVAGPSFVVASVERCAQLRGEGRLGDEEVGCAGLELGFASPPATPRRRLSGKKRCSSDSAK